MESSVLLRHQSETDSYLLVSVCALSYGPPVSGTWAAPCVNYSLTGDEITISRFSPEESDLILAFHSELMEIFGTSLLHAKSGSLSIIAARVLDFGLMCTSEFRHIENTLKSEWDQLNQKLDGCFWTKFLFGSLFNT